MTTILCRYRQVVFCIKSPLCPAVFSSEGRLEPETHAEITICGFQYLLPEKILRAQKCYLKILIKTRFPSWPNRWMKVAATLQKQLFTKPRFFITWIGIKNVPDQLSLPCADILQDKFHNFLLPFAIMFQLCGSSEIASRTSFSLP